MFCVLKKIYGLLPAQRQRQLLWLTAGMLVVSFVELGLAGAISLLGVALADPASLEKIGPLWKLFQALPTWGEGIPQSIKMLILVMGAVCLATVVKNVFTAIITYWQNIVSQGIGWDICIKIFDNYMYAPYIWHTQENPGELVNYLGWRANVSGFLLGALQAVTQLGIMFFLMVGAFVMAPMVALLLYGVTGCVALIIYKAAQNKAKETGARLAKLGVELSRVTHAALHGIREVQIYGQQQAFNESHASFAKPISEGSALQSLYSPMPHWGLESVGMILLLCAVLLMTSLGESVAAITGTLTLMAAISWRLLPALNKIVSGILQVKTYFYSVQTLFSKFLVLPSAQGIGERHNFTQSLQLHHIDFHYPDMHDAALVDINMNIPKGSMVGLVGLSGAGKSTLVGVLTGLLIPSSGSVCIDGKEISSSPGYLSIGYVPQSPYILDASLAENVGFADWGGKPDESRVLQCCRMAAMDFLDDLPQGINTVLGDRGVRLSGGQVQRVAIARALYGNPDILLFDEATSALDGAAEASIQNTILNLRKDMTIVVVAHRLSTVEGCDTLYWLDAGRIYKEGASDNVLVEYERYLQSHVKGTS